MKEATTILKRFLPILAMSLLVGCAPGWHDGSVELRHVICQAAVYGESLSLQGGMAPLVSVTDYGFRVNDVHDDTGKQLALKSFQIFWMKGLFYEAEFDAPAPTAKTVNVDVVFRSRSGNQRIEKTLPIERGLNPNWHTQLRRWQKAATIE